MASRNASRGTPRRPAPDAPAAPHDDAPPDPAPRLLVKLRASRSALRAAESRARLRPLFESAPSPDGALALDDGAPRWYVAEPPDGAATPWDLAHARVADQLGVDAADVLFAEPDVLQRGVYLDDGDASATAPGALAVGADCADPGQDGARGKAVGPGAGWHLGDGFSQLGAARDAVAFAAPRTRIAHLDTGYYRAHETVPAFVRQDLERNFVERDGAPGSAQDPDNRLLLLDNSGHGTGTIGILAGRASGQLGGLVIGGAPEAEVVPLRIADSVVLLRTSAFARALDYARTVGCDVATMSMGGLPSRAWSEAVDAAYEAGLCLVAAAGNNVSGLPTRHLVYPARYRRVIAACGVMADGRPYTGLKGTAMEGNFGPGARMAAAIGAFTPNIPWPRFGCDAAVRQNGEGTSSATPQVAAAVALWYERWKAALPRTWRRVEAVRHALFSSARRAFPGELGHGVLRARAALDVRPRLDLEKSKRDDDSFAFLRVLTGLGIAEAPARERMFNLELAQRWLLNPALQALVADPDDATALDRATHRAIMEAVLDDRGASRALRQHVAKRWGAVSGGRPVPRTRRNADVIPDVLAACEQAPALESPPARRLRAYAADPSLSATLATADVNEVTLALRWEALEPGPVGEYLAVDDVDAKGVRYPGVDLDDPRLLARDGWAPSEGNPAFHQQMVYAVAMKTIGHFERALGRPVLWRPRADGAFNRRLVIRPHALRQANAFYSPQDVELRFGYFEVAADAAGDVVPGSRVYACLSHDIIAHETTHAVLDGMYRRFNEPTNPDVLALHEAFADIVALLQHFTLPDLLAREIASTRGDLAAESTLGRLAVQFGYATGGRGALREAIGSVVDGVWRRSAPDPAALRGRLTPHARGAILVAAVFDAYLAIYRSRTADLFRLASGGTGVLPDGEIPTDLVRRLADEAARTAAHVLTMCIRALDYLPPVDVTFFEYLRAVLTADADLVRDDRHNYRLAFVEAFRRRGIYPVDIDVTGADTVRSLGADTLVWKGIGGADVPPRQRTGVARAFTAATAELKRFADACLYTRDREALHQETETTRGRLQRIVARAVRGTPGFAEQLGLARAGAGAVEVHALRSAAHTGPDGRQVPRVIVALTQDVPLPADRAGGVPAHTFRGGATLVVDLTRDEVRYCIRKRVGSATRRERTATFLRDAAADPLRAILLSAHDEEPFAALHALEEEGP